VTTLAETHWRDLAARLADELARAGTTTDPAWLAAVRAIPRHELVSWFVAERPSGRWRSTDTAIPADQQAWLNAVYSDTELVTVLDSGIQPTAALPAPFGPGLAVRALDALDVQDGHRVLHIGTGSGYLTALLCHRLGDQHVYSLDIDHSLITRAGAQLAAIGRHPTLHTGDAWDGLPAHGPYDRIIATCSVGSIPPGWLRQLGPGGVVVADVKVGPDAGNVVRLERLAAGRLEGRFAPTYTAFTPMHHHSGRADQPCTWAEHDTASCRIRPTRLAPQTPWSTDTRIVWFLAGLDIGEYAPYLRRQLGDFGDGGLPTTVNLDTPDGSWATVYLADYRGEHRVTEGGQLQLWSAVERAHRLWCDLGQPGWDRFGLTVTPNAQTLWLDEPGGEHRWTRPTQAVVGAWTKPPLSPSMPPASPAAEHRRDGR
jgi:protein-L-isoaspartate O-methyltransferase